MDSFDEKFQFHKGTIKTSCQLLTLLGYGNISIP